MELSPYLYGRRERKAKCRAIKATFLIGIPLPFNEVFSELSPRWFDI